MVAIAALFVAVAALVIATLALLAAGATHNQLAQLQRQHDVAELLRSNAGGAPGVVDDIVSAHVRRVSAPMSPAPRRPWVGGPDRS